MEEQHVTTSGAARVAERSPDTIRDWARRGHLEPVMAPGGIRICRRSDVERVAGEMGARRRTRRGTDSHEPFPRSEVPALFDLARRFHDVLGAHGVSEVHLEVLVPTEGQKVDVRVLEFRG